MIWQIVTPIAVLLGVLLIAPFLIMVERWLLALWQDRYGPNRVGPFGLLQLVADALKMFFKEDWIPPFADKYVFLIAPAIIMATALLSFSLVPVFDGFVVFESSVGLLLLFALSSLGAYSVVLAGWSSNNKYSLLGGLRGAAQMLSYEVFMGLSVMGVVIRAGSFNLSDIVSSQSGLWNIVPQFIGCVIFFIAALAETHRLPFDLPESEGELIAGFHSEYSGMKFGTFFIGEYVGITLMAALMTVFFLGGWQGPFLPPILWFLIKMFAVIKLFILVRAALPRPRYDQLIVFGWKVMLPLALLNLVMTSAVVVFG